MPTTISEIASLIHKSRNMNKECIPHENRLLDYLYSSYCRLEKKNFDVYKLAVNELDGNGFYIYQQFSKELYQWYKTRYHNRFHMMMGRSGGNRTVDDQQGSNKKTGYRFDELYEEHTFLSYLTGEHRIESTNARDFILHASVAFLLQPAQVDELLSFYGLPVLHVRNIHHLAIYTVLSDLNCSEDTTENPFDSIRNLYEQACQIAFAATNRPSGSEDDLLTDQQMILEQNSTRYIQGYLFGKHVLTKENMLLFIARYANVFDRRHQRLLAEHRKCAALFSNLYDTRKKGDWDEEPKYNLYHFLTELCLQPKERSEGKKEHNQDKSKDKEEQNQDKKEQRKHYREYLLDWIIKKNRHPTRESMIIFWIYAYSFYFMPEIAVPASFAELDPLKKYAEYVSSNEDYQLQYKPFRDYVDVIGKGKTTVGRLYALRYLSDSTDKASPLPESYGTERAAVNFYGAAMISFLNSKLREYSWFQLDGKKVFDNVILHLQDLEIHLNSVDSIDQVTYHGNRIVWSNRMNTDNVPIPLVLITEILLSLKKEMDGGFPLACSLYEYV